MLKKVVKWFVLSPLRIGHKVLNILSLFNEHIRGVGADLQISYLNSLTQRVTHVMDSGTEVSLVLHTPNSMCLYRAKTFSSKEPETLSWIEEFGKDQAVLFDIGSNIGLYSIFHAQVNKGSCVAFEPSFFNLKILLQNINLNNCHNLVTVVPNPLSNKVEFNDFNYGSTVEGGALSAFAVDFGHDGELMRSDASLEVLGMSLDWMLSQGLLKKHPNLVKIDVDGIEHLILEGARKVLMNEQCRTVLVEVNNGFIKQASRVHTLLSEYGFVLREKLRSDILRDHESFSETYNQIWVKDLCGKQEDK